MISTVPLVSGRLFSRLRNTILDDSLIVLYGAQCPYRTCFFASSDSLVLLMGSMLFSILFSKRPCAGYSRYNHKDAFFVHCLKRLMSKIYTAFVPNSACSSTNEAEILIGHTSWCSDQIRLATQSFLIQVVIRKHLYEVSYGQS